MLEVKLLGEMVVEHDGQPVDLPPSRKTRALLAYLIVKSAPQRRDALCELFWEIPDDPRGALRWSLSRIRPLINEEGIERLVADRERVEVAAKDGVVDLFEVREAVERGMEKLSLPQLRAIEKKFRGPLISGLELPNQPVFESWRLGQAEEYRQLHLEILHRLVDVSDAEPVAKAAFLRRLIDIDPINEENHVELIELLVQNGRAAEAEQQYRAAAQILGDIGPFDTERLLRASRGKAIAKAAFRARPNATILNYPAPQSIRFCNTDDGVRIAYTSTGSGPPLVKTANWLNHLEYDWESPVWRGLFRSLAEQYQLIRFDERGNGLSDWEVENLSLEAFVKDFETVVDAVGLERFPILGVSQGCCVAIEYAARHPERVSKLVLFGGFARGWKHTSSPHLIDHIQALMTLMSNSWGRNNPAFRQMFSSMFLPDAPKEQYDWFNTLQKVSTSPENAVRLLDVFGDFDVRARLNALEVATLVMHCREDAFIPCALGREMAAGIPNARFLALDSANHLPVEGEPALRDFLSALSEFLGETVSQGGERFV